MLLEKLNVVIEQLVTHNYNCNRSLINLLHSCQNFVRKFYVLAMGPLKQGGSQVGIFLMGSPQAYAAPTERQNTCE